MIINNYLVLLSRVPFQEEPKKNYRPELKNLYPKYEGEHIKKGDYFWYPFPMESLEDRESLRDYLNKYPDRRQGLGLVWVKIKIILIFQGVFFYECEDIKQNGHFEKGSYMSINLIPCKIDFKTLQVFWKPKGLEIPKDIEFDDYNGKIKIEVV